MKGFVYQAHWEGQGQTRYEDSAPRVHRQTKAGVLGQVLEGRGSRAQKGRSGRSQGGGREPLREIRGQDAARGRMEVRLQTILTGLRDHEEELRADVQHNLLN